MEAERLVFTGEKAKKYIAGGEIKRLVNLALALGRPILVEGEPGCGKTSLASAIAEDLDLGPPIEITVRSTSQAKDLLYRFDALRRLQDVQGHEKQEAQHVFPYITLEPLGRAIAEGKRCVVLIDEIDKADIDFPNDLLEVLDRFRFTIDDLPAEEDPLCRQQRHFGRMVEGPKDGKRPIVVITSNREKQLPEPFLRRCLYLFIRFPEDSKVLAEIVGRNVGRRENGGSAESEGISVELIEAAVKRFLSVRRKSLELAAQKPPAIGELIDWIHALHFERIPPADLGASELHPALYQILFKTIRDLQGYPPEPKPVC
jgi:MoxR-like ATPase